MKPLELIERAREFAHNSRRFMTSDYLADLDAIAELAKVAEEQAADLTATRAELAAVTNERDTAKFAMTESGKAVIREWLDTNPDSVLRHASDETGRLEAELAARDGQLARSEAERQRLADERANVVEMVRIWAEGEPEGQLSSFMVLNNISLLLTGKERT